MKKSAKWPKFEISPNIKWTCKNFNHFTKSGHTESSTHIILSRYLTLKGKKFIKVGKWPDEPFRATCEPIIIDLRPYTIFNENFFLLLTIFIPYPTSSLLWSICNDTGTCYIPKLHTSKGFVKRATLVRSSEQTTISRLQNRKWQNR